MTDFVKPNTKIIDHIAIMNTFKTNDLHSIIIDIFVIFILINLQMLMLDVSY
jgi:hypothetical protein